MAVTSKLPFTEFLPPKYHLFTELQLLFDHNKIEVKPTFVLISLFIILNLSTIPLSWVEDDSFTTKHQGVSDSYKIIIIICFSYKVAFVGRCPTNTISCCVEGYLRERESM